VAGGGLQRGDGDQRADGADAAVARAGRRPPLPPPTKRRSRTTWAPTPPAPTAAHEPNAADGAVGAFARRGAPVAPSVDPPHPHPSASPPVSAMRPGARQPADASASSACSDADRAAAAFVTATLTLRLLRRAIALRHPRTPYWAETLEQRVEPVAADARRRREVSGARASAGGVARRVRVDVGDCASVLERARHGPRPRRRPGGDGAGGRARPSRGTHACRCSRAAAAVPLPA
jgi:hypothetical protein